MDWPTATSSMSPLVRPVLVMWWWLNQRWPGPVLCQPTAARHPTSPHQPPIGGLVVAGTSTTTSTTSDGSRHQARLLLVHLLLVLKDMVVEVHHGEVDGRKCWWLQ